MRRYPLADLLEATGLTESGLTRRAGLSGTTLKNAREMGLTADAADRYATRCGLHPGEVWSDWFEVEFPVTGYDVDGRAKICAAIGCGARFIPAARAPHALYCSARCRNRMKARRYRSTPHGAETNRRHRRAYYAENSGYELRQKAIRRGTRVEHQPSGESPGHDASTTCGEEVSHSFETVGA